MSRSVRSTPSIMASSLAPNEIPGNRRPLMRVVVIRHHEEDSAGFIGDAFAARGADLSTHLFPKEGSLPDLAGLAHIVMLGSTSSVYDDGEAQAWIEEDLAWLRRADAAGVPVLGICFGAQLLAAAFGGTVEPAGSEEIGWVTIDSADPGLIPPGPWLEFHHDRCVPRRPASRGPVPSRGRRRAVPAVAGLRRAHRDRGGRARPGPDPRGDDHGGTRRQRPGRPPRRHRAPLRRRGGRGQVSSTERMIVRSSDASCSFSCSDRLALTNASLMLNAGNSRSITPKPLGCRLTRTSRPSDSWVCRRTRPRFSRVLSTPVSVPLVTPASAARCLVCWSPQIHNTNSTVNAAQDRSSSARTLRSMWFRMTLAAR